MTLEYNYNKLNVKFNKFNELAEKNSDHKFEDINEEAFEKVYKEFLRKTSSFEMYFMLYISEMDKSEKFEMINFFSATQNYEIGLLNKRNFNGNVRRSLV